jgi:predicted branched-subunit amino acid permease
VTSRRGDPPEPAAPSSDSAAVVRDALAVGVATGTYGLSFGALSTAAGLTVAQTCALSLLMFTGASQFAFVGLVGAGGGAVAGALTAVLLGVRNGLYGLQLSRVLGVRGPRRLLAAHVVIDESAAMAQGRSSPALARTGFWTAGLAVFVLWNLATAVGAWGARSLASPQALGLDVAASAAFLALLAPRMRGREAWAVAVAAALVAVAATPFTPAGVPVLLAALVTGAAVARRPGPAAPPPEPAER